MVEIMRTTTARATDPHHVYDGCAYTVVRIRDGEPGASERRRGEDIRPLLDAIPEGEGIAVLDGETWYLHGATRIAAVRIQHHALDLSDHTERYAPTQPCLHQGQSRTVDAITPLRVSFADALAHGWV